MLAGAMVFIFAYMRGQSFAANPDVWAMIDNLLSQRMYSRHQYLFIG